MRHLHWLLASMLWLALACVAQADDGVTHIILGSDTPSTPITLAPGLYMSSLPAQLGQYTPHISALRLEQVDATQVVGTLELIQPGDYGELIHVKVGLTGTIEQPGIVRTLHNPPSTPGLYVSQSITIHSSPYIVFHVADESLANLLGPVEGSPGSDGIQLRWQPTRENYPAVVAELGREFGEYSVKLVPTSDEAFQQVVAQVRDIALARAKLREEQEAYANLVQESFKQFTQQADQWLQDPVNDEQRAIVDKARTLYTNERQLLANASADPTDPARRQAASFVTQINGYWWQMRYASRRLDAIPAFSNKAWRLHLQDDERDPCTGNTGDNRYDAAPACAALDELLKTYQQRAREVNQAQNKARQESDRLNQAFGCIYSEARNLMGQSIALAPECDKPEQVVN